MKNITLIHQRFMKESPSKQLGALAANLARITSFSNNPQHKRIVAYLLEESKWFIEWIVPGVDLTVQEMLVKLQIQLALQRRYWSDAWSQEEKRKAIAEEARAWSRYLIELSGAISGD